MSKTTKQIDSLLAISPIDGRYRHKTEKLSTLFSEYGLIATRVEVEVAWFKHLCAVSEFEACPALSREAIAFLDDIVSGFSLKDAQRVKDIEATTNHDVKAVEYFLKERFDEQAELAPHKEFIHFACTSEDINNLSYALLCLRSREQFTLPRLHEVLQALVKWAEDTANIPMMSRTHGQTATPTTVGKEFANVAARLQRQIDLLAKIEFSGKFNGAVGNYNAHHEARPTMDWPSVNGEFVKSLGLTFNEYTTQIEPHDMIAEWAHACVRCNQILKDFDRDMWAYISLGYFKQKVVEGEVGSSTMPHKVNPIDFENSEGNIGIANQAFHFFAEQLTTSRWQRDLVDSTVLRNLGVAVAHSEIAYQSTLKGLNKCAVSEDIIRQDLNQHWEVLAEPVQTVMRYHGIKNPYEKLKSLTRGKALTQEDYQAFVASLDIPADAKQRLHELTPETYTGYAQFLAESIRHKLTQDDNESLAN